MSQKRNYSRSFIILQENEKGHGISSDKLPTGYTKIETRNGKCKVFFYVQNLKSTSKPYHMILVCNKKDTKKLIKLGELNLDEYGKSEISREYDENDVAKSGISIDKVIGAAISQFNGSDMVVLMSGFNATDIPDSWKTYPLIDEKNKETNNSFAKTLDSKIMEVKKPEVKVEEVKKQEVKEVKIPEVKVEEVKKEEIKVQEVKTNKVNPKIAVERKIEKDPDSVEKQPDKKESDNIFDKYEEIIENTKKDICEENKNINSNEVKDENRENNNEVKDENRENNNEVKIEKSEIKVQKEENKCPCYSHDEPQEENTVQDEIPIANRSEDYPIGKTGEFFKKLADEFEDLGKIFEDVRCCRWYRIPMDYRKHKHHKEDYNKYALLYYPMMAYYPYIQKSGYYFVGYKYDNKGKMKYIVYGILGTKNKFDQPFGGRTGFVSWVPIEKGKEDYDDTGCWLMFYDFKNAAILVPQR